MEIIHRSDGTIEIDKKRYSFKEDMYVRRVRFVPKNNDGWGVSKDVNYTTNFNTEFLDAFVEEAKRFL
ncbi:hypothetical protein PVK64_02025 [Aliivibrio sp. S4TY2]|uniref:hypothetical protein n=1 Tax=unclassified Aliivibrio TaxID=2645654 RepID=UPI002378854A|nr:MULTISPECIES: hypothetical protein [unclassified Aliivibrio]MDD9154970.1 hypothetical protein [Aliivibrio sp. S4TY2]MDD9158667.1 hypothetical protein [Aliivibrio sp. S4TY1]MDD9162973.1 hypothetical protein [Aliivibrio sp. S4MY2]MDD9166666.1 hypothetical protein [Aliivibrio sp. S4MY4]MDD9184050.1 hypothetical protein [Aliivibrio sp. S4MY3]